MDDPDPGRERDIQGLHFAYVALGIPTVLLVVRAVPHVPCDVPFVVPLKQDAKQAPPGLATT